MCYDSERPLSDTDIRAIADYLDGSDQDLRIAMSELGFAPYRYDEAEMCQWLEDEAGVVQCPDTGTWHRNSGE
jgi:hypothetical protein